MRVGVFVLGLTSCQWLAGIDPTHSQPIDASVEASGMDVDAAAPCNPGGCVQILAEGNPGPNAVAVIADRVAYGVNDACYGAPTLREVWSVPKIGGDPERLASDVCMVAAVASGDTLAILEPMTVVRLALDGTETVLATSADNRGATALFGGSVYWMSRHDGIYRAAIDQSSAPVRLVTFGLQVGSDALIVDAKGLTWGEDTPHELWTAAPDGGGIKMVASLASVAGGMAELSGVMYVTTRTIPTGVWRWDGKMLTPISSAPLMVTPLEVVAKAPYVYVADVAGYGKSMGAIWRYDPSADTWLKLADVRYATFDVDDDSVFYSEQVDAAVVLHRRLSRMAR